MTALQRWLLALAGVTLAVAIAYLWIDRPLALFVHGALPHQGRHAFEPLTHIPDPLIPVSVLGFFGLGLWVVAKRSLPRAATAIVVCSLSETMAQACKDELKFLFGRTWPETWYRNNPSFIHDGVFGFNWFHGGGGYASFPSGHMTATCAVIAVLWIYYPRLKPLYAAAAVAVAVGLIGANFHFLSDVIAGSFLGATTGWLTSALFDRLGQRSS